MTYFYLWPSYERNAQDGMVLVKVTAPIYGTVEETLALERSSSAADHIGRGAEKLP